jgi:acyl carrier protein
MTTEQLIAMLAEHTGKEPSEISLESTFADLGIDSLDTVDLVMNLEEKFNIVIELDQRVTTVNELLQLLQSKVAG